MGSIYDISGYGSIIMAQLTQQDKDFIKEQVDKLVKAIKELTESNTEARKPWFPMGPS